MSYINEAKFLVRLVVLVASLLIAIAGIIGVIIGIVNLALFYPLTIIACLICGYALAVIGTRILFPVQDK
jgi:hypothetical protein